MKNERILTIISSSLSVALLVASIIVLNVSPKTNCYDIPYSSYENVKNNHEFKQTISQKLQTDFKDLYLANSGEITTDIKGNISNLDFDIQGAGLFLQIQFKNSSSYTLYTTTSSNENSKISFGNVIDCISLWKSDNYQADNYVFYAETNIVESFIRKDGLNFSFFDDALTEVDSLTAGKYSYVTVFSNSNVIATLYLKME